MCALTKILLFSHCFLASWKDSIALGHQQAVILVHAWDDYRPLQHGNQQISHNLEDVFRGNKQQPLLKGKNVNGKFS